MSQTVIKVENLYKEYKLGVINHGTLTHDLQSWWARVRGKDDPNSLITLHHNVDAERDSFLALKDVNFKVKAGERVGVIGKNGAGKSTLLKILSKITSPTRGNVKIRGRVGSLLEVGTGFHPELTGRENIYLNGAILGMSKKEIDCKLDEIIDFAGVEKHVDTPVKRYSSGMNVRLGFAVAAHLEPEILVVDEVLAVGDAEFQRKAIGKMEEVSKGEGRTILFVSHNMVSVRNLCTDCIVLNKGEIFYTGKTDAAISEYNKILGSSAIGLNLHGAYNVNRRGSGTLSFTDVQMLNNKNNPQNIFFIGDKVRFKLSYLVKSEIIGLHVKIVLKSNPMSEALTSCDHDVNQGVVAKDSTGTVYIDIKLSVIRPGEYFLYYWLGDTKALTQGMPEHYDVIDSMTEPLLVKERFDRTCNQSGCFSLPSKLLVGE